MPRRFPTLADLFRLLEAVVAPTRGATLAMATTVLCFLALVAMPPSAFYSLMSRAVSYQAVFTEGAPYLFGALTRLFDSRPADIRIAWIGGSTTRESLWSEEELAEEIAARTKQAVEVIDLTSSGQNLFLSLALAERAACAGRAGIVVVGMNLSRQRGIHPVDVFASSGYGSPATNPPEQHFKIGGFGSGIKSTIALRGEILALGFQSVAWAASEASPGNRHQYLQMKFSINPLKAGIPYHLRKPNLEAVSSMLGRIEAAVSGCGGRLIYMISPLNPLLMREPEFADYAEAQAAMAARLRQRAGTETFDLNSLVAFDRDDFYDWGHLRSEAKIHATTKAAANVLAGLVTSSGN